VVVVVVVVAFPSPAIDRSQGAEGLAQYGGQRYAMESQKLLAQVRRENVAIRGLWALQMYQPRLQDS
jgi:hypothetical protein